MNSTGTQLGVYSNGKVLRGVVTGLNQAFIIGGETRDRLIGADPACEPIIKPVLRGDYIRKWRINKKDQWLIYTYHGIQIDNRSPILEYLEQFRADLERRATQQAWYELQQPQQKFADEFALPKIVFPDIAKESRFAFDYDGSFLANTAYGIPMDDLYLLGVLNSSVVWEYLKRVCSVLGDPEAGGRLRLIYSSITKLPIPIASRVDRDAIASLVEQCTSPNSIPVENLEQEIDERVAKLYGLPV
jgi:hypothetical protein